MPSFLGIDSGLTVTKAVLFDVDGTQIAVARRRVPQHIPKAKWVERDMLGLWFATAEAIREAIQKSHRSARDILGVSVTAHGDGIYLLDRDGKPVRAGILSLDSRAGEQVRAWQSDGKSQSALVLTGQVPHVSAPSALLAWIKAYEPDNYRRIAHVLSCKDWLRYCLCAQIGTDRTEASTSFTDVHTQQYSSAAMSLYGLEHIESALPDIHDSSEIVGEVTQTSAQLTGLCLGTPVVAGLHDVTASALGIGGQKSNMVDIVAGTYSINEIVSEAPIVDGQWFCRNGLSDGQWNNMAISPASSANYDWFLDTLCGADKSLAATEGTDIHNSIAAEMQPALTNPSSLLFHPYLFGSPYGDEASGSFLGLRAWHDRGHMLAAVLEGIAFNHRVHVEALKTAFSFHEARLTGGVSRHPVFAQLFADILGLPVHVLNTDESAAFGAVLCAGVGAGVYKHPHDDPRDLSALTTSYYPDVQKKPIYEEKFQLFHQLTISLNNAWLDIERFAKQQDRA
ncbi:FGGY-family carbohydrate kinase [Marinomonas spartinae]|uniref:FGGY-family carbohydrate kinase n=1 Tax=Marinomonas spartinae TaxID=1792290 RepID=UPI0018F21465|nr:FGGY-family carbohydrate kinase [Marinomonas spartinae]MBJ7553646.1 carbohydrate kinase [Marinomonas spartinae]